MNINDLIAIVKKKIQTNFVIEHINIEDKSFLLKKKSGHKEGKIHIKIEIISEELKILNKIESNKKIYKILSEELDKYIHSIQISIR